MTKSDDITQVQVYLHHCLDAEALGRLPESLNAKQDELSPSIITARLDMIAKGEPNRTGIVSILRPASGKPPPVVREEINWRLDKFDPFTQWFMGKLEGENPIASITCTSALWLLISPKMLQVGSGLLWHDFIVKAKVRSAMRKIVAVVAASVGAEEALYVADYQSAAGRAATDDLHEGKNYEQTREHLKDIAPDAQQEIESLLKNATPTVASFKGVYLIDTFKDILAGNDSADGNQ